MEDLRRYRVVKIRVRRGAEVWLNEPRGLHYERLQDMRRGRKRQD